MSENARVTNGWGGGCPKTGSNKSNLIAQATGRKEPEVVREAIAQYFGRTDPSSVKSAIRGLQIRVANLEQKLAISGAVGWLIIVH